MELRRCTKCREEKPFEQFYSHWSKKKQERVVHAWCKACCLRQPRRGGKVYRARSLRTETNCLVCQAKLLGRYSNWCSKACYFRQLKNQAGRKLRQKAIAFAGGACAACGYSRCLAVLNFHHLDPSKKKFHIVGRGYRSWKNVVEEINKCRLLCVNCHRETHEAQRNKKPDTYIRLWTRARKQRAVDLKGGKCSKCGYFKCLGALTFHHLDPAKKDFNVMKGMSWARIEAELSKVVLLCGNCHGEVHSHLIY